MLSPRETLWGRQSEALIAWDFLHVEGIFYMQKMPTGPDKAVFSNGSSITQYLNDQRYNPDFFQRKTLTI